MKLRIVFLLFIFIIQETFSCPSPQSEQAQEKDAIVQFVGAATKYEIQKIKNHALISFNVSKTIRGESRQSWSLFFRSNSLPANLIEFQKRFGQLIRVGLRKSIAPGLAFTKRKVN